jgi:SAM-dependent methyltransferase
VTFDGYAAYYDLFYRDKDYAAEARYVSDIIRSFRPDAVRMMEWGCGTGQYTRRFLDLGYQATGVDLSAAMLAQAAERCRCEAASGAASFIQGDLRNYRSPERFDVIAALFHVVSYLTLNAELLAGFETARAHLEPGGLFVFDCWYGPGVLSDPPRNPVRTAENDALAAVRRTTSLLQPNLNTVRVRFDLELRDKVGGKGNSFLTEEHAMRYLFMPEILDLAERSGMGVLAAYHWLTRYEPSRDTWYAFIVLKAF